MKSLLILYLQCCFWSCHFTLTLISQVSQVTSIISPSSTGNNNIIKQSFHAVQTNIQSTNTASSGKANLNLISSANSTKSFGNHEDEENNRNSSSTKVHREEESHRQKRNIGQLAYLIHFHTNYNWKRLLNYGNWCGLGGNRAGDNSVVDNCDLCCKQHDFCYHFVKQVVSPRNNNPLPFFPPAFIGGFIGIDRCNPYGDFYHFDSVVDPFFRGRVPYCLDQYGSCARRVCTCDVEFVKCLRKSTCPGVF